MHCASHECIAVASQMYVVVCPTVVSVPGGPHQQALSRSDERLCEMPRGSVAVGVVDNCAANSVSLP